MPPILQQKSTIISLLLYVVGIILHIRGRNLNTDQTAMLSQGLGLLFDVVATNIMYFAALHKKNATNIQINSDTIAATPGAPDPVVTPVAQAIATGTKVIPILFLIFGLTFLTGCANLQGGKTLDDKAKVFQAEQIFNVTLQSLTVAYQNHLLTDDEWTKINPIVQAANAALNQLHTDVDAKVPIDGTEALRAVGAALDQLTVLKWSKPSGPSNNNSTRPVGPQSLVDPHHIGDGWCDNFRRSMERSGRLPGSVGQSLDLVTA